jgi:riboflavin kinase / FMN adenylyltransferase
MIIVDERNLKLVQQQAKNCVIALGFFDGVHMGHQKVIETAKLEAKSRQLPLALMSFKTHPINILSDGKRKVENLTTLCTKQKKLQDLEIDVLYLVDFTKSFANLTPQCFVEEYLVKLGVVHAVAGFDYSYGIQGSGKLAQIPFYSKGDISVSEVGCMNYKNEKISSTAIRQRLKQRMVHEIHHFLGHHYISKANLNGYELEILEDTMLPETGRYKVILKNQMFQYAINVIISPKGKITCLHSIPKELQGEVYIEWLALKQEIKWGLLEQTV